MKTLDEVIKAIEECRNSYVAGKIIKSDALYYLKMYRSDQIQWEADREDWREKWESYIEAREMHLEAVKELKRNNPLTWDELKAMEGKPVWVDEYDAIDSTKGWHRCQWYLVNCINNEYLYVCDSDGDENHFDFTEIGKTWTAYKKERDEDAG